MGQPAVSALAPLPFELVYDDGEPLETGWHVLEHTLLRELIRQTMAEQGRADFYVGTNQFVYYSVEQARDVAEEVAKGLLDESNPRLPGTRCRALRRAGHSRLTGAVLSPRGDLVFAGPQTSGFGADSVLSARETTRSVCETSGSDAGNHWIRMKTSGFCGRKYWFRRRIHWFLPSERVVLARKRRIGG